MKKFLCLCGRSWRKPSAKILRNVIKRCGNAVSYSPKYCPIGKIHVTQSHSPLFCHGRCQVAAQKFKRRLVTKTRDPADDVSVPVVEVIEPKRVSFMFTFGLLKLGWFSALIESIRN